MLPEESQKLDKALNDPNASEEDLEKAVEAHQVSDEDLENKKEVNVTINWSFTLSVDNEHIVYIPLELSPVCFIFSILQHESYI